MLVGAGYDMEIFLNKYLGSACRAIVSQIKFGAKSVPKRETCVLDGQSIEFRKLSRFRCHGRRIVGVFCKKAGVSQLGRNPEAYLLAFTK